MDDDSEKNPTRRRYLATSSALAATTLAGCNGIGGEDDDDEETDTDTVTTDDTETDADDDGIGDDIGIDDPEPSGPVELLHGWSAGDGKAAFDAMLEGFEAAHDVETNAKAIGGSANTSLDTRISQRIKNDNPPGAWAEWPGANLEQFTNDDVLDDIKDDVWTDEVKDAYSDGARAAAKVDGDFVCVPTDVHRINNLFYNESLVADAGVDPASIDGPTALVDAFERVESETDAIGFAHSLKGQWTTLQLFATVFIGQHGIDAYQRFVNGNGSKAEVETSLEAIVDYSDHMPEDANSISFQKAGTMVSKGKAAFMHQGDWLAGMFQGRGFEFGRGWGHVPFPGTDGVYQLNMDAWVSPSDSETPIATRRWLRYLTTKDAQVRFNQYKGAIPPRTDVSTDEFPPFQTKQMEAYRASESQPPSLAHGLAVPPQQRSSLKSALSSKFDFTSRSVDETATAFVDALSD